MGRKETEEFKSNLLKVLEDDEVIRWLWQRLGQFQSTCQEKTVAPATHSSHQGGAELDRLKLELQAKQQEVITRQDQLQQLQQENHNLSRQMEAMQQQLSRLERENAELSRQTRLPADIIDVLSRLRADPELLKYFRLPKEADDLTLLIHSIAVLSQEKNLRRLWEHYKSRCEAGISDGSVADKSNLQTVLDWHNMNWPDKPYTLQEAKVGEKYDFEKQSRLAKMTGEIIDAVLLPGIPGMKLKPVVRTR